MRHLFYVSLVCFAAVPALAQPTYTQEVSRILQAKCQQCHRPNDIAPFTLMSYGDASTWAADIKRVVSEKVMPPWKPVDGHGNFKDSFALTNEERTTLVQWVDGGVREGDASFLPEPLPDTGQWQLGEPDLLVGMAEEFTPPRGKDVYRCFVLPTNTDENRFISTVEVLPGNRKAVHHVLLFLDTTDASEKADAQEEGPGYTCFGGPGVPLSIGSGLGGWVPGSRIRPLPDGIGIHLPAKARIIMQVHYFPGGNPGPDQTKVGIYFSKKPVERRLLYIPLLNNEFKLQPGEANKEVTAQYTVPFLLDAKLIQIAPHMHMLGRKIQVEHTTREGEKNGLILIDNWEFNWQSAYTYMEPVPLKSGTSVKLTCTFDNSEGNPRNPSNPLQVVGWGEGTQDEMCLTFLGVTFDNERLLPFQAAPRL